MQTTPSAILERLQPRYDDIVASIYRAGSGCGPALPWLKTITDMLPSLTLGQYNINQFGLQCGSNS